MKGYRIEMLPCTVAHEPFPLDGFRILPPDTKDEDIPEELHVCQASPDGVPTPQDCVDCGPYLDGARSKVIGDERIVESSVIRVRRLSHRTYRGEPISANERSFFAKRDGE